jgi:prefoldin subunit 5
MVRERKVAELVEAALERVKAGDAEGAREAMREAYAELRRQAETLDRALAAALAAADSLAVAALRAENDPEEALERIARAKEKLRGQERALKRVIRRLGRVT